MRQMKWFDRRFTFDAPVGIVAGVVERLRGTPARLEERLAGTSRNALVRHPAEDAWSILEHVGHLGDLEELWDRRLSDVLAGAEVMTEADLTNRRTHEAGHDDSSLAELLKRFRGKREAMVARLEALSEDEIRRSSLHPRLRVPMRAVDLALFVAEHDDHHLARMGELLRSR